jgi:hypothetical protein
MRVIGGSAKAACRSIGKANPAAKMQQRAGPVLKKGGRFAGEALHSCATIQGIAAY